METKIIKSINNKIKYEKIYHISDIHIRNTEDHKIIYEHVFNNLYDYLKSGKSNKALIVITGDILHNKDKLTAVGEEICINFFEKLSSIMDTVIIPGNHDFNEKNNNIQDSLSIILYKRDFKNIYYLKNSGVYRFNNIIFGVSSLIDNKFVKADYISDDGLKIALYHGPVHNSKNSKGFEFSDLSLTKFNGYDLTLLGDIHFYQYLNDDKTIAYASSLISQNFSETDKYHGVLVWNLIDKTSEYKIITNDYQFSELEIKDNDIFYHGDKIKINKLFLPKYSKLRITHTNCEPEIYNGIVDSIKVQNPFVTIVHNKIINNKTVDNDNKINYKSNSLKSIIDNEIKNIPEEYYDQVKKLLYNELKNCIQMIDNKLNWRLISLKFSNMFTYGKDNIIDFTKLTFDEITGLFGPNSAGKSSLVDVLLFSLFDDYSRNYQDKHKLLNGTLINTNEDIFSCCIRFSSNNILYQIEKNGKRRKAKTQHTFDTFDFTKYDFCKIINDKEISLNGVDRIETLQYITKLIGTYNDFCISSICFQHNSKNKIDFLNMTPIERKSFLNVNFNLDGFKLIENKYKNIISDLKSEVKALINLDDYKLYVNNDKLLLQYNEDLVNIKNEINTLKVIINENKVKYDKLLTNLKPIDIEFKKYSIDELSKIVNEQNIIIKENKKKLLEFNNYDLQNDKFIHNLYQKNIELTKKLINIEDTNIDIDIMINKLNRIKDKIQKLDLIKDKNKIIQENVFFEKDKIKKIIELKSKILPNYFVFNETKFSDQYICNLQNIYDTFNIINYDEKINYLIIKKNMYETTTNKYLLNNYDHVEEIISDFTFNENCINCTHNKKCSSSYSKTKIIEEDYCDILENEINNINDCIKNFNIIKDKQNNFIKIKNNLGEYITYCIQNNYLIELYLVENSINHTFNKLNKQIIKYDKLIFKFNNINKIIEDFNKNEENIKYNNDINNNINRNNEEITKYMKAKEMVIKYNNNIQQAELYIQKIKININHKKINNSTSSKVDNLKKELDELESILTNNNNKYFEITNKLDKYISQKDKYNNIINKINNINNNIELNSYLFNCVSSKGIPRKIINIKLQSIEEEVNYMLKTFINKRIEITKEIDDIKILIHDNINKINFGGGMESFIIMLAFKIAFITIFNIPHCGLLIIDEGVSVLDKEYASKFNIICDFIKKYYNHIILITHIDTFYDYTVDNIKISKKMNQSCVAYC